MGNIFCTSLWCKLAVREGGKGGEGREGDQEKGVHGKGGARSVLAMKELVWHH